DTSIDARQRPAADVHAAGRDVREGVVAWRQHRIEDRARRQGHIEHDGLGDRPRDGALDAIAASGNDANASAIFNAQIWNVRGRDVAVGGRLHLVARREVDPELESGHPTAFLLGHLGVDDAAPGGHPLDAARLQQADVADAVVVAHAAFLHDRHRLETAVRVIRKAADVVDRLVAAEGVEHQEGVEALLQALREDPSELDAVAVGRRLATDEALDAARAESGCRDVHGGNVATPGLSASLPRLHAAFNPRECDVSTSGV